MNNTHTTTTTITRQFSNFAVDMKYDDIPPDVIIAAKKGVLDFIGVALIGSGEKSTGILRQTVVGSDKRGAATVFGTPLMTSATKAAIVNGYAVHCLDFDDVQPISGGHMSGAVLAATLALAESHHLSGKALICAYVVGFEIGYRLGAVRRFGYHLRDRGVHPTGFLCHFGAAGGASNLLALDTLHTRRSFGIVAGHASGLMRSFGTMCKGQNAGNAAQNAVLSAQLSQNGFTGPEDIFDGDGNIFAIHGAEADEAALVRDLGKRFEITNNTFKCFACAGWRNPIMEAMIAIASANKLKPANIEKVELKVCKEVIGLPNYPQPKTGLEAKFSAQYAAAVALADKAGNAAQFSDQRVTDPVLAELGQKVTLEADNTLELNQVRASVRTTDGREFSHFVEIPKGDPRKPLDWEELEVKFRSNARAALTARRVNELAATIRNLETVSDVADLARLCRPGSKAKP